MLEALDAGALASTPALRHGFVGVVREIRRQFQDDGFGVPGAETALEPTRQLLYLVSAAPGDHTTLRELRDAFRLDGGEATEAEVEHARGSLSGRNRALLDTVAGAVKEDLLRVKDALDLHLRTQATDLALLAPQVEALGRVADTLGMLGLGVARGVVDQQRTAMADIVDGRKPADEGALLDVAGALLYVDATLDDQVARLGAGDQGAPGQGDLAAGEADKVLDVLAREAIANFADARQSFVAFIETGWDHAELVEVPAAPYRNPNNYVRYSGRLAEKLAATEAGGAIWANQFDNTANRQAHLEGTAIEIWEQTGGNLDGFICSVGSGGTLAGCAMALQPRGVKVGLADPDGSALHSFYTDGELASSGNSITEGIGQGRITANLEGITPDFSCRIPDDEALPVLYDLLEHEGLCLGGSSGVNVAGAIRLARHMGPGHTIVTVLCDYGTRYQTKLWNPEFLRERGLPVPRWLDGGRAELPDVTEG